MSEEVWVSGSMLTMVDETNNGLASLTHPKRRAGDLAIVTDESGLTQIRVDLYIDWLDLNFIVVKR